MHTSRSTSKALRVWTVILSIVLLLVLVVGGTLAILLTNSDTVENKFEEAYVICQVNRSEDVFDVTNKGNVPAYIRTAVVVNWMDDAGNVRGIAPTDAQYTLQMNDSDWHFLNGFYYYLLPVSPEQSTSDLITGVFVNDAVPDGYQLSVEVVAEAVQAEGVTSNTDKQAVLDAWGSNVGN